jgi:hypothetical protein
MPGLTPHVTKFLHRNSGLVATVYELFKKFTGL